MKSMHQLRQVAPFLAELLDFPGDYASSVRRAKFLEHRLAVRIAKARDTFFGQGVALSGPSSLLEKLLRLGLLSGLEILCGVGPDGELARYNEPPVPLVPASELPSSPLLCFGPVPQGLPAHVEVVDLGDESLNHSTALQDHLRSLLKRATTCMADVFEPDNTVLFAGNVEYYNFMRVSEALRSRGMRTIFLGLTSDVIRFKESFFDLCLDADGNVELFYSILNAHAFKVVHFQGWMGNHEYAAAACALCQSPIIVELNDLPHYFLVPQNYDAVYGLGNFGKEDKCLKYICTHTDGLLANCMDKWLVRFLDILGIENPPPCAPFHGYPLTKFFKNESVDTPFSVVFPGSLLPGNFPAAGFAAAQVIRLVREYVVPQGIEYHVWANPMSGDGSQERFWDYHHLAHIEPLFQLHPGLPPEELTIEISRFGFGAMFYLMDGGYEVLPDHYASLIPTKVFTMFEAGLPIIYNEEFEYIDKLNEKWNFGIRVSQEQIKAGIRPLIETCDYKALRCGVANFRSTCSMDEKIEELLAMYEAAGRERR